MHHLFGPTSLGWKTDKSLEVSILTKKELETEIARLVDSGEESTPFKDALKELAQ